uniref:DNA cytosine methyltransferase n=1 Tax=Pseudomonas sp. G.S.17 TaxID=3137451 RepID=UPI0040544628
MAWHQSAGGRPSNADKRGLRGERSGLFWEVIRILKETQPRWVVLGRQHPLTDHYGLHNFRRSPTRMGSDG